MERFDQITHTHANTIGLADPSPPAREKTEMSRPTCKEIATDYKLWQQYADPYGNGTEAQFNRKSVRRKINELHEMFPSEPCDCKKAKAKAKR